MAYVPLYAEIWDDTTNTTKHTACLRGLTKSVGGNLNSHFGKVFNYSAYSDGSLTSEAESRVIQCEAKILNFTEKENEKKITEWRNKLSEAKENLKELEKKENVSLSIDVEDNKKFQVQINGYPLKEMIDAYRILKETPNEL